MGRAGDAARRRGGLLPEGGVGPRQPHRRRAALHRRLVQRRAKQPLPRRAAAPVRPRGGRALVLAQGAGAAADAAARHGVDTPLPHEQRRPLPPRPALLQGAARARRRRARRRPARRLPPPLPARAAPLPHLAGARASLPLHRLRPEPARRVVPRRHRRRLARHRARPRQDARPVRLRGLRRAARARGGRRVKSRRTSIGSSGSATPAWGGTRELRARRHRRRALDAKVLPLAPIARGESRHEGSFDQR
ncbi:hypothetical protein EMIHUDRAFT_457865 [Emiliania huxleyi CCMP1516]|uniref:Uncharacterized protein n=2 Tax=Emiliania huxleyi TaxID=2903 RepID=A0A0D3JJX5_EMIH1|nr:hypothetical protein EMIHUDRAFT_457865 [Emiliania huxleyi CCMP1516]EOD23810.1 hypothetical protein EMIHUDRAFT_457865 [Emiliania huxleyi CCMP1516]|eukprot:XP_005776239.1 hypothetical protein EMIHUDRAFT_457865 [Emiliania huxleyi CCMP1516]